RAFGPMVPVFKGENPNIADAVPSAETLNRNARKIVDNFPEGTGRDAVPESRAKPEIWLQFEEFKAAAEELIEESGKLVEAAKTDDLEAFQTQFKELGAACGGCHLGPRESGGKFRFEKQ
ncbi:MAG: c-type cytochrome, partial [Alphaproteobacteria bacterium]